MTPAQWEEVKNQFHRALEQPQDGRRDFLNKTCSSIAVRSQVEWLLEKYASVGSFLSHPAAAPWDASEGFSGTPRFAVQELLGAGAFGTVYRVLDKERNAMVALKKFRQFYPSHLLRFKREFRSLVDLSHPNLVQLYELFGDNQQWFFTMECVEGVDFISYVRASDTPAGWERLRQAFFQLAVGVRALHSSGHLHCDLKPSNVLAGADGRVVILDFGLVRDSTSSPEELSLAAGSPAYMAPEQASGDAIDEAADWYAVGVMLFKALSGQLPFDGNWAAILQRKQQEEAPSIADLAPEAPADLGEACRCLLERNPEARFKGVEILLAQVGATARPIGHERERFVGRTQELQSLKQHFGVLSSGQGRVVLLKGRSGIGKTCLVSQFLDSLNYADRDVVIFKGRCREVEALPFKAIDPIADAVVRYLRSLSATTATGLLPRQPELLLRLFPVFGELQILSAFPTRPVADADELSIRRRAFGALVELFGRMTDRGPVVISIDDLQWADLDSIAFLAELMLSANAPALLLILSFRSEELDSNPSFVALQGLREQLADRGLWAEIELQGLSEPEGQELLQLLQENDSSITAEQRRKILQESGGSPLLLAELLRFASRDTGPGERGQARDGVLIYEMIRERANSLPPGARWLLEAVSVAGEPIPKSFLYRFFPGAKKDAVGETGLLLRQHLLRATPGPEGTTIEPFHDKVSEACLSWLSPAELRDWHAHLAELFGTEANIDPQRLLRHYQGAGNLPSAFEAALKAAANAESGLAFEQAARFYAEALKTAQADEATQANLHRKRAEALRKAGRGYESAQCFLQAAAWPAYNDTSDMRRLASEQLMRAGYLPEGSQILSGLLREVGIPMPAKPLETFLRSMVLSAFLRLRGLRWRERSESEIPRAVLRDLDLIGNAALVLLSANQITAKYLAHCHMLRALRVGEPSRLAQSFTCLGVCRSIGGVQKYARGMKLVNVALALARRLDNPHLLGTVGVYWACVDLLCQRIEDGLIHSDMALTALKQVPNRATSWVMGSCTAQTCYFLAWGGRIRELSNLIPDLLQDARARGDVYTEISIRWNSGNHLIRLAQDDPEGAIREIAENLHRLKKAGFELKIFYGAFTLMECHLYAGRTEEARRALLADWTTFQAPWFAPKNENRLTVFAYARGRTALGCWLNQRSAEELKAETERYAAKLARLGSPWSVAFSVLLQAGLQAGMGQRSAALHLLEKAEVILRQQSLRLIAAAALRRRGELGDDAGAGQIESADAFMKSENIVRPDRMAAMILPGKWD